MSQLIPHTGEDENRKGQSSILVEFFERMSSWEAGIVQDREVSLAQMHVLEVLGNHEPMRMKELAGRLGVTTGTLTVMINRLLAKGYLEKVRNDNDRRSWFIRLSSKGRKEYAHHHRLHDELTGEICDSLGQGRSEEFFGSLSRILELF